MVPPLASLLSLEKETEAQSPSTAGQLGASLITSPSSRSPQAGWESCQLPGACAGGLARGHLITSCVSPQSIREQGEFPRSQHPSLWQLWSSSLPLSGYLGGSESVLDKISDGESQKNHPLEKQRRDRAFSGHSCVGAMGTVTWSCSPKHS